VLINNDMKTRLKRLNRNELFIAYCTTDSGRKRTVADVARMYGLSKLTLEEICTNEKWVEKRKKFEEEQFLSFKESRAKIIEQTEQKQYEIWSNALKMLEWELALIRKKQERWEVTTSVDPTGKLARKVGAFDQRQLMESMKVAVNGFRVTLGLPTEITKGEMTNTNKNIDVISDEEIAAADAHVDRLENQKNETIANTTTDPTAGQGESPAVPTPSV